MKAPPTEAEIERAAELVSDVHDQWPLLLHWIRATGMRLQETLTAERTHLGRNAEGRTTLHIGKPKGFTRGRARTIVLSPEAVALLPKLGKARLFDKFPLRATSRDVSSSWGQFQRGARKEEGLADFTMHDLRDAYAVDYLRRHPTHLRRLSLSTLAIRA